MSLDKLTRHDNLTRLDNLCKSRNGLKHPTHKISSQTLKTLIKTLKGTGRVSTTEFRQNSFTGLASLKNNYANAMISQHPTVQCFSKPPSKFVAVFSLKMFMLWHIPGDLFEIHHPVNTFSQMNFP